MKNRGFTLIELIVVVGIMAILATVGTVNYLAQRNKNRLELTGNILVRELNLTMERSRAQENGYQWWIHFNNPAGSANDFYTVCYGTYVSSGADCVADGGGSGAQSKRTNLSAGLEFSPGSPATQDVVFSKATGLPTGTTTIIINSISGTGSQTVTVNANGRIDF